MSFGSFELYNPMITLDMIVWAIAAGLILATVSAFVQRHIFGSFVETICRKQMFSPEKACTLDEIGAGSNFLLRRALQSGSSLRKVVFCANEEEAALPVKNGFFAKLARFFSYEVPAARMDVRRARFYIPEDLHYTAEVKYETKGSSLPVVIASIVLIVLLALAVRYVMPQLFNLLGRFLSAAGS